MRVVASNVLLYNTRGAWKGPWNDEEVELEVPDVLAEKPEGGLASAPSSPAIRSSATQENREILPGSDAAWRVQEGIRGPEPPASAMASFPCTRGVSAMLCPTI